MPTIFMTAVFSWKQKAFTSNPLPHQPSHNWIQTTGSSYLVEGCATGTLQDHEKATLFSQTVNLAYGGTAINGVDLGNNFHPPLSFLPMKPVHWWIFTPIIDNLPEGIWTLKIYTLAWLHNTNSNRDSTEIQIRDYDTLGIDPPRFCGMSRYSHTACCHQWIQYLPMGTQIRHWTNWM